MGLRPRSGQVKLAEEQQEGGTCNKMSSLIRQCQLSRAQGCTNVIHQQGDATEMQAGHRAVKMIQTVRTQNDKASRTNFRGLPFPRLGFQQHSQVVWLTPGGGALQ